MTQEINETPEPGINQSNGSSEKWLKWLDVGGKLILAAAAGAFSYTASNYESKMSATTLLNQREQAETNLRASLLHELVEPILGRGSEGKHIDPERERLLVELLTLNFHDHFEFKPLLAEVYTRLGKEQKEEGQKSLVSVARRVRDRQINMLKAVAATMQEEDKVEPVSFFFKQSENIPPFPTGCGQSKNTQQEPVLFINGLGSERVCSYSPDKTYRVEIAVVGADFEKGDIRIAIDIWKETSGTVIHSGTFTLTPFDFPLTDSYEIDLDNRFALVLDESDKKDKDMRLNLVWFPRGYITERERPTDYVEVRKMLGMEKTKR